MSSMGMRNGSRRIKLAASMLCADPACLKSQVQEVDAAGVDLLHIDMMDGHFVPNMTGGADVANEIRAMTDTVCDYHIMAENPERQIRQLKGLRKGDRVCFHVECGCEIAPLLEEIRGLGAQAGLAMNPGTPISAVEPYLDAADYMLLLIVNPGFRGQPIIPRTLVKLTKLRERLNEAGMQNKEILVDGAVTLENMQEIVEAGADNLVCGPFTCFNQALGGIEPTLTLVKEGLRGMGYVVEAGKR